MIKGNFKHCKDLAQFNKEIRMLHETGDGGRSTHGPGYCNHHDEIIKLAPECESYRELGVMQGATSACAAVAGILDQQLIDIEDYQWTPYKHLWDNFEGLKYVYHKKSSLTPQMINLPNVDMMLSDSYHNYDHVIKELKIHAQTVNKYIIFHDTSLPDDRVYRAVTDFCMTNSAWQVIRRDENSVGFTTIKRI